MENISIIEKKNKIKIPDNILNHLDIKPLDNIYLEYKENKIIMKKPEL